MILGLIELSLGDILCDRETTEDLADALRGNTMIKRVTLREYNYSMDHVQLILDALKQTRVQKISVGPQSQILAYDGRYAMAVCKKAHTFRSLLKLDFNMCRIGGADTITFAAIMAKNTTVTHVMLQENNIEDVGAVAIARMLKQNRTMQELILDNNNISPFGQKALRDAIYDDSSFTAMENCNHILQTYFYNPRAVFGPAVLNDVLSSSATNLRSKTIKNAITKKLKRMVQKKYKAKLEPNEFLKNPDNLLMLPNVLGWMTMKCDLDTVYAFRPILLNVLEGANPQGAVKTATV